MNSFDERLRIYMSENNISQIELSNKLGLTRGYISAVYNGKKAPSKNFIQSMAKLSGKSETWWMTGKEVYDNLDSLNALINTLINTGDIKPDGSMNDDIRMIINTMIDKEIKVKLENLNK